MRYADMSGHHVPMFAVPDGPPGVAAAHLSVWERGTGAVYAQGQERTAMLEKLQVPLHPHSTSMRCCKHRQGWDRRLP